MRNGLLNITMAAAITLCSGAASSSLATGERVRGESMEVSRSSVSAGSSTGVRGSALQGVAPSISTRFVYVSSGGGDDSNDGLSPHRPKRTLGGAAGLIRGSDSVWILLRRGESFEGSLGSMLKELGWAGDELVIASYGGGGMPTLADDFAGGFPSNVAAFSIAFGGHGGDGKVPGDDGSGGAGGDDGGVGTDGAGPGGGAPGEDELLTWGLSTDGMGSSPMTPVSIGLSEHDRRVIVVLRGFTGSDDDPEGLGRHRLWWQGASAAMPWFEETVRAYADVGVRRIILKNPAGMAPGDRMPPDPLRHMDEGFRSELASSMSMLRAEYPGLEIGLYCGSGIDLRPETLRIGDGWLEPDFSKPLHRAAVLRTFELVPESGFDFVMVDNISGRGGGKMPNEWMGYLEAMLGIPVMGEAYPTLEHPDFPISVGGRRIGPDRERIDDYRYMAYLKFTESRNITTPGQREHYVGLSNHSDEWRLASASERLAIVDRIIAHGFVPYIYPEGNRDGVTHVASHAVAALRSYDDGVAALGD